MHFSPGGCYFSICLGNLQTSFGGRVGTPIAKSINIFICDLALS
jgi:hypothetical protein